MVKSEGFGSFLCIIVILSFDNSVRLLTVKILDKIDCGLGGCSL